MDEVIEHAKLLTKMNITELAYQQCLIKNQDNIFKLIDRLHEIEQLYHSVVLQNHSLSEDIHQLSEENKELKKKVRNLEMDNNVLYFDLQYYKPSTDTSDTPDLTISE